MTGIKLAAEVYDVEKVVTANEKTPKLIEHCSKHPWLMEKVILGNDKNRIR